MTQENQQYIDSIPEKLVEQYEHDMNFNGMSKDRAKILFIKRIKEYAATVAKLLRNDDKIVSK